MSKTEELQKHTLNLFEGDFERLQNHYPDVGASFIIRRLVRAHVKYIQSVGEPTDSIKIEDLNVD